MVEEVVEQLLEERLAQEGAPDTDAFLEAINTYLGLITEQDVLLDDKTFHQMLKYRCILSKTSKETIHLLDAYIHKYLQEKLLLLSAQPRMGTISVWILPRFVKITLYVDINNDTIGYVKRRVNELTGVPVEQQKYVHNGLVLEHLDYTLGQYQLDRGMRIYMTYYVGIFPREALKEPQSVLTGYEEPINGSDRDAVDWNM